MLYKRQSHLRRPYGKYLLQTVGRTSLLCLCFGTGQETCRIVRGERPEVLCSKAHLRIAGLRSLPYQPPAESAPEAAAKEEYSEAEKAAAAFALGYGFQERDGGVNAD